MKECEASNSIAEFLLEDADNGDYHHDMEVINVFHTHMFAFIANVRRKDGTSE